MSSFVGHTPGPWVHYDAGEQRHDIQAIGKTVARVYCIDGDEAAADRANAALLAAAPTLLAQRDALAEALYRLANAADWAAINLTGAGIESARAALALLETRLPHG